ncbi:MAG: hypothetical protein ABIH42_05170 [Planctomycetota bacterium]
MKNKKTKMGRPRKPPKLKFSKNINVFLTPAEYAKVQSEAKRQGLSLSSLLAQPWREGKK